MKLNTKKLTVITRLMRQRTIPRLVLCALAAAVAVLAAMALRGGCADTMGAGRWVWFALSSALFLFAYTPLIGGVWTSGMLPTAGVGGILMLSALYWEIIVTRPLLHAAFIIFLAVTVLMAVICGSTAVRMYTASCRPLPDDRKDITAVVLGCRIKGMRPSLMLRDRLECAAAYLRSHPAAVCIVSGGQGIDEPVPEAEVMGRYLIDAGIEPQRIIEEPCSVSTRENIAFSLEIMRKAGLPPQMAIVSDRFHQYRALRIAASLGVDGYPINRRTSWYLTTPYWLREIFGIIFMRLMRKAS
ncbi:MAG: YdcF family protein [Ruminococcaceae bacterium]|nr:YdcF family protein [Oscillospiraceae bacterium]